jgi:hypothetical protein
VADIETIIKKLKNLPQYSKLSTEELRKIASNQLTVTNLDVESLFNSAEDKKLARELLTKYLEDFKIENISDNNLLKQLVYLEVFQLNHLQKVANDFDSTNNTVPLAIIDSLHKNLNQIVSLKDRLGLTKQQEVESDAFKAFQLLKKKAEIWRQSNQASRTLVCPHCGNMTLLRIRMEAWESQKHPFFKDRVLGNEYLVKCYLDKKLSKEDVAKILDCSNDYIDWLIEKWSLNKNNIIN